MYIGMPTVMCTLVGAGVKEDPKDPWMELDLKAGGCEPNWCWEPYSGPLEEQCDVLMAGPSLYPHKHLFLICMSVCLSF